MKKHEKLKHDAKKRGKWKLWKMKKKRENGKIDKIEKHETCLKKHMEDEEK